jgi:rare lipoprotein A
MTRKEQDVIGVIGFIAIVIASGIVGAAIFDLGYKKEPPQAAPNYMPKLEELLARTRMVDYALHRYIVLLNVKMTGMAVTSWYENGDMTASGRPYNPDEMTAAHKTLPFGTVVVMFNQATGKHAVVEITDRGPFKEGRVFDVSRAAAERLGIIGQGVAVVDYRIVFMP